MVHFVDGYSSYLDSTYMNEKLALITAFLEEECENNHFPGLSISIVHDQEILLARGWGFRNLGTQSPAGEHTTYRIGSITKVFTSMLVMQAADRGLLGLDDPLSNIIPEISGLRTPATITLRHCITHTSGLPFMPSLPELMPHFDGLPSLHDLKGIRFPELERLLETLAITELQFAPGAGHAYSNFGMALAGEAAARISGWLEAGRDLNFGFIHIHFDRVIRILGT